MPRDGTNAKSLLKKLRHNPASQKARPAEHGDEFRFPIFRCSGFFDFHALTEALSAKPIQQKVQCTTGFLRDQRSGRVRECVCWPLESRPSGTCLLHLRKRRRYPSCPAEACRSLIDSAPRFARALPTAAAMHTACNRPPRPTSASGTCRDFAFLFMEAARSLGFGARFVTGYLYDLGSDRPGERADRGWLDTCMGGRLHSGCGLDRVRPDQPDRGGTQPSACGDHANPGLSSASERNLSPCRCGLVGMNVEVSVTQSS